MNKFKLKFYPSNYDDSYVMHCKTKKSAEIFEDYLLSMGWNWHCAILWDKHKSDTGYRFNGHGYDAIDFYTSDLCELFLGMRCNVLDFDDFDWDNSGTKLSFDVFMEGRLTLS